MFASITPIAGGDMKRFKEFLFVVVFTSIFVDAPAHAYLDSGTISLALQGAAGAVATAILFAKSYVARIRELFRRLKGGGGPK
jgi:hypothetical protein